MTYMMTRGNEEVQIYDRSYRLRHNKPQSYLDRVTYGVVGTGAVVGGLAAPAFRGMGVLLGSSLGFGVAVPVQLATKGKE